MILRSKPKDEHATQDQTPALNHSGQNTTRSKSKNPIQQVEIKN